jgi:hypothetical protein
MHDLANDLFGCILFENTLLVIAWKISTKSSSNITTELHMPLLRQTDEQTQLQGLFKMKYFPVLFSSMPDKALV